MSRITTPPAPGVEASVTAPPPDAPAEGTEPTITESVVTTLGGMVVGGTAIWFLAPICFVC